eukprot:GHVO01006490.1.p1 GENE.GHVO01006490.1~~GHVO01006490.1.p1  ORF type:complete len:190 (-),score=37.53 GHVO01006490.1:5-574(-)
MLLISHLVIMLAKITNSPLRWLSIEHLEPILNKPVTSPIKGHNDQIESNGEARPKSTMFQEMCLRTRVVRTLETARAASILLSSEYWEGAPIPPLRTPPPDTLPYNAIDDTPPTHHDWRRLGPINDMSLTNKKLVCVRLRILASIVLELTACLKPSFIHTQTIPDFMSMSPLDLIMYIFKMTKHTIDLV